MSTTVKGKRYSKNCLRIRGSHDTYIKGEVMVNFAPLPKKKTIRHTSILPTFNNDRKHFTLAFQLPSTQTGPEETLFEDHNRRVGESILEISEIYFPKPRSRHRYCGVCRDYYQDYKQHIQGQRHMSSLETSEFQKCIKELALKVQSQSTLEKQDKEERVVEPFSEEQIFRCLSAQTLESAAKLAPLV